MQWARESSSGRLALKPVPPGHVAAPDPHAVREVRMDAGGPGPLRGVRGLGCRHGASLLQGHVASPDPSPGGEQVRGHWPGDEGAWPMGLATPSFARSYG